MAEIDRVCTVEATGITLTIDSGTFSQVMAPSKQGSAPFLRLWYPHNRDRHPSSSSGTFTIGSSTYQLKGIARIRVAAPSQHKGDSK
jgi:hypothetical protein